MVEAAASVGRKSAAYSATAAKRWSALLRLSLGQLFRTPVWGAICSHAPDQAKPPYTRVVTGNEFLRRLRRIAQTRGIAVRVDQRQGKGSHSTLFYGHRKTILKDPRKEIGPGLLHSMLTELGITRSDFEE